MAFSKKTYVSGQTAITADNLNAIQDELIRVGGAGTEPVADYVVSEGTSGNWRYRKWASGVAECWGQLEDVTTTSGHFYWDTTVPSDITVEQDLVFVVSRYGTSDYRTTRLWFYTVSGSGIYVRDTNGNMPKDGTKVSVSIYFRGTWK